MTDKLRICFLCTGNSCRSQMAEGWARALKGHLLEVYSAGIEMHGLNPRAIRVMSESGIDIRSQFSKTLDALAGISLDYVVTVCGHAHESCPAYFGGAKRIHQGFDDPPRRNQGLCSNFA